MSNLDNTPLEEFAENLRQEALTLADAEDQELMLADSYSQIVFDMLSEAGEFDDPLVCYHQARGMQVSGYGIDEEEGRIDVLLNIHTNTVPPRTVTRREVEVAFTRLRSFLDWSLRGGFVELEESSPVFDMAAHIHAFRGRLTQVRSCVVTDGKTTVESLPDEEFGDVTLTRSLWDIVRLQRLNSSGLQRETINIDFERQFNEPLPCLPAPSSDGEYRAFLVLLPGHVLRTIYADYGSRLLEQNVRSFLQARGKVNRGIRDTILSEPNRFLAYNNGITVTAENVQMSSNNGAAAISRLEGFQIVNGGQTTASLLSTDRGRADLSNVSVAAKIIQIESGDDHDHLVRNVSRYSNSQNRISEADFSANDPLHVRIEELSRTVWAPAVGGSQRQTRWFYERARGQYQVERAAEPTPARRRAFSEVHPSRQRFSKTDLAKFENTWDQRPHIVSRGAQKNFADYMIRFSEMDGTVIDRSHFERLVAKAILFRTADRVVRRQDFGGYKANIVTYTIALISHETTQRIDLNGIWRDQSLSEDLEGVIADISHEVHRIVTNPPDGRNITEWCKSEDCWERIRGSASRTAIGRIRDELLDIEGTRQEQKRSISGISASYVENVTRVLELNSGGWNMLASWGSETGSLNPAQRQLANRLVRAIRLGHQIKPNDAAAAVEILELADELGFRVTA